jgi:hypothetical protein
MNDSLTNVLNINHGSSHALPSTENVLLAQQYLNATSSKQANVNVVQNGSAMFINGMNPTFAPISLPQNVIQPRLNSSNLSNQSNMSIMNGLSTNQAPINFPTDSQMTMGTVTNQSVNGINPAQLPTTMPSAPFMMNTINTNFMMQGVNPLANGPLANGKCLCHIPSLG